MSNRTMWEAQEERLAKGAMHILRKQRPDLFSEEGAKPTMNEKQAEHNAQQLRQFCQMVDNVVMSREKFFQQFMDERRDINKECGYPETSSLDAKWFKRLYERQGIATRIIEVKPAESWRKPPVVYDVEDSAEESEFERLWKEAPRKLRGQTWYQEDDDSPFWEYLQRADKVSGIGHYSILLIGLDDLDTTETLEKPVPGIDPKTGYMLEDEGFEPREILYLRVFDESVVEINKVEDDKSSPRYGQPVLYKIRMNNAAENQPLLPTASTSDLLVHWTRVLHIAEDLTSNEFLATPRCRPSYDRIHDLSKLYGGSAEMYWRGAFPGLSIETHPNLGPDEFEIDKEDLRSQMQEYMNGLQRYLAMVGVSAKSLAPQVVDPTPQIQVQLTAICIQIGVPQRILMGSERGQLASSQDDATWNDRIRDRQNKYLTPRVICPFIDRLIMMRVLPIPKNKRYCVVWPDLDSLTAPEKATIAVQRTDAMSRYIAGNGELLMSPLDFLVYIMDMRPQEAKLIIENALKKVEEDDMLPIPPKEQAAMDMQQQQLDVQAEAAKNRLDASGVGQGNKASKVRNIPGSKPKG